MDPHEFIVGNRCIKVKTGGKVRERVMGFEPMMRPWKGRVLPLHYTRIPKIIAKLFKFSIGVPEFESGTS